MLSGYHHSVCLTMLSDLVVHGLQVPVPDHMIGLMFNDFFGDIRGAGPQPQALFVKFDDTRFKYAL